MITYTYHMAFWFVFSGPQAACGYYEKMATGTSNIIELNNFHNKLVNFVERNPLRQPSKLQTELYSRSLSNSK